jgi:NTE family protein
VAGALVLGGSGVHDIAWEIGLAYGLAESGVDLRRAELVVGTSAGAEVAVQLRSDVDLSELYAAQVKGRNREIRARPPAQAALRRLLGSTWPGDHPRRRARIGRYALQAPPAAPAAERRAVIERRLPLRTWPSARLLITAVDARTGELQVFDAASGVDLVDAVAASCAEPGLWPPVRIAGHWYIDGSVRSPTNLDLAQGYDPLVVVAPGHRTFGPREHLKGHLRHHRPAVLLTRDAASRRAVSGHALDPAGATSSAKAGRAQGRAEAHRVRDVWDFGG